MNTMEKLEMARQRVDFDGTVVSGKGASTDVIEASARAYLSALNRLARQSGQRTREVGP